MNHPRPKRITHLSIEMRVISFALSGPTDIFRNITALPTGPAHLIVRMKSATMKDLHSKPLLGVPMPRYLTQHTLACLTRQGAEALAQRMQAGGLAHAERALVNMLEGKMFVEFRANSREDLEAWLKAEGMHYDFLVRIEWEMQGDKLQIAV